MGSACCGPDIDALDAIDHELPPRLQGADSNDAVRAYRI
jgi:hypothetical protein